MDEEIPMRPQIYENTTAVNRFAARVAVRPLTEPAADCLDTPPTRKAQRHSPPADTSSHLLLCAQYSVPEFF